MKQKITELKSLKIKNLMIAIVILAIIVIIVITGQNYIDAQRYKEYQIARHLGTLRTQVLEADKNIKYKTDEKISGNNIYIYFYADDLYTEQNYGNGYIKIDEKNDIIDVTADTYRLKDILLKVKCGVQ